VAILADDDHCASGPHGFPAARRLVRYWARAVMLHSAAGEPEHYRLALAGALHCRRLLLIETDTAHRDVWLALLLRRKSPLPLLAVVAGAHPAPRTAH
jgi:hypothetical protein